MNIIKCAFGGVNENFVLCGSETGQIFIWNRDKGDLLVKLEGHARIVNSVHWNPTDQYIFASVSDDRTVRVWGIE
jgi:WD40 repeat protein